eukprot:NODE_250_length_12902_cov_0.423182.p1 type:complete len:923 gc:universal NODE_250_length_12902_cov_0.423182:4553-7321(+)
MSAIDLLFESKAKKRKSAKSDKRKKENQEELEMDFVEEAADLPPLEIKIKSKKEKEKEKKLKAKLLKQQQQKPRFQSPSESESDESVINEPPPVVEIKIKTKKEKEKEKKLKAKLLKQQQLKNKHTALEPDQKSESSSASEPALPPVEVRIKSKSEKLKEKKLKEKLAKQQQRLRSQSNNAIQQQSAAVHQKLQQQKQIESNWYDDSEESEDEQVEAIEESSSAESTESTVDDTPRIVYADKKKKRKPAFKREKPNANGATEFSEVKQDLPQNSDDLEDWEKLVEPEDVQSTDKPAAPADNVAPKTTTNAKNSGVKTSKAVDESTTSNRVLSSTLRCPIFCILGHVDVGKTKLLDNIRQTNVQGQEHGGITQQIGATYMPIDSVMKRTNSNVTPNIPGLLVIDTPGHESFSNLRSRGSSLCNIAILVVDITHGLEPQTIESMNLLKQRKTPFIVALNKVDRLYGWKSTNNKNESIVESIKHQEPSVIRIYENKLVEMNTQFQEQGFNSQVFYKNKNMAKYLNLVPTSAFTGLGISDLLSLLITLTTTRMSNQLTVTNKFECTVLDVKVVDGLGSCIDVILVSGVLCEGDTIIVCGLQGPIMTNIRALLTPQPMRESRVKGQYVNHSEVRAAMGVRICGDDLQECLAGCSVYKVQDTQNLDEVERLKDESMTDFNDMTKYLNTEYGVHVQASTLGSLEALLTFLKDNDVQVHSFGIGPIHKKDVRKANMMMDHHSEYACMLCFDCKGGQDVMDLAKDLGVTMFMANVIYHLFDSYQKYSTDLLERKRIEQAPQAVFPCCLKTISAFNKRDPIILGVDVIEGILKIGTPLCVIVDEVVVKLGKVTSIEKDHKSLEYVRDSRGGVAIKIESTEPRQFGRHFTEKDVIYSCITRQSIDVLKDTFRDTVEKEDWQLIVKLKQLFNIK